MPDDGVEAAKLEIRLPESRVFNRIVLRENIRDFGQRIEEFAVDARIDGSWREIGRGTTVGYKRILRIPSVTTDRVRVRVLASRTAPTVLDIGLHRAPVPVTTPRISRDGDGEVSIVCDPPDPAIRFTTDGSDPVATSRVYRGPFPLPDGGTVKAQAHDGARMSGVASTRFGVRKAGWRVHGVSSEEPPAEAASHAIDGDARTFWHTQWRGRSPSHPHFIVIVIDLGERVEVGGFGYLPRQDGKDGGVVERYEFYLSDAPERWGKPIAAGRFGNIANSPVQQIVDCDRPAAGRYVKFVSISAVSGKPWAGAAEIDVFETGR